MFFILISTIHGGCENSKNSDAYSPSVYIEETEAGYELIRNGKPFYIKGGAAHPHYLEELITAGANTARVYDTLDLQQTLDKAEKLGLAVVVDIPMPQFNRDPEFYEDQETFNKMKARIERLVQQHKEHPALLYWNLGNELFYPYFYKRTKFFSNFNSLIGLIHEIDPNHPVSTVTIGANKLRVLSITRKSPDLDFISFNSFGVLSQFSSKLQPIRPFWDGPHVIAEWGVNGYWESAPTAWKAPIEETSTKKAEQINQRYKTYIEPLKTNNSLGSFVFYWGKKNEVTPTWYSMFGENKKKTQAVFELDKIWNNHQSPYTGPELDYVLINGQGAFENIILPPESPSEAEVFLTDTSKGPLSYAWEIREESWHESDESTVVENVNFQKDGKKVIFTTPETEGPYRLFVYLTNNSEYFATANVPFYVLNPENGE